MGVRAICKWERLAMKWKLIGWSGMKELQSKEKKKKKHRNTIETEPKWIKDKPEHRVDWPYISQMYG